MTKITKIQFFKYEHIELYFSNSRKKKHSFQCDDTRCCTVQFWPPDDEHMCSKHVEAYNKLIIKQDFVHQVG